MTTVVKTVFVFQDGDPTLPPEKRNQVGLWSIVQYNISHKHL